MTLVRALVRGNSVSDGGGIYNDAAGSLELSHSAVSGNEAGGNGGGIDDLGDLTLVHSLCDRYRPARRRHHVERPHGHVVRDADSSASRNTPDDCVTTELVPC
jgi:hypothetical protein